MTYILFNTLILPLAFGGIISLIPSSYHKLIRYISLISTLLTFFCSTLLWIFFDESANGFQFVIPLNWMSSYEIYIGIDGISLFFIILTTFLSSICILFSFRSTIKFIKEYAIAFLVLEFFILSVFSCLDLLFFYIAFESVLLPMFLIIGVWGSRERKIHAAYQFFLYTLLGSVLMLVAVFIIYLNTGTFNFEMLFECHFSKHSQLFLWIAFFLSFSIKIPMVPVHIWLPEAHVEAPTAGSIILAGILLKLGGYGFLRLSIVLFPYASIYFTPFLFVLCLVGVVYTSICAIRQVDFKKLIAYTSIAHMNIVVFGIFSREYFSIEGSILLMISHGIISGALFLLIGVLYDRHHTRLIKYYSGIGQGMPIFSYFLLFFNLCNFSLPGTSSFVGELLVLTGLFKFNTYVAIVASLSIILGGIYSIWLVNRINGGYCNIFNISNVYDINRLEFHILLPLVFLAILIGIYPSILLDSMYTSVRMFTHLYTL
jgi:proton-translocating NADH-quinone oxidoreductase chain M